MNKELDDKLCQKYPKIFIDRNADKRSTAMCWGFNCDDGWYWLIDNLCSQLQWDTDNNNKDNNHPQIIASQVKEKFGGLRFYVQEASTEQYSIINWAESLSYHICENCGSTKNIGRTQGWIKTICKECVDKEPDKYTSWKIKE